MHFLEHVPLWTYSTMRLGGQARWLVTVHSVDELHYSITWAQRNGVPFLVLGGGSNVLFTDAGFPGLVVINAIMGFEVIHRGQETLLRVGAGESWDTVVARAVELQLSGIEALSLIPGTAGATPVQNVGAYGQDISQVLVELEAYDTETESMAILQNNACAFAYRKSIFNGDQKGRYAICSITLRLHKGQITPPLYATLQRYLDTHGIADRSPASIRKAVIAVRNEKLPDPTHTPNTGSFFKNPIITTEQFKTLSVQGDEVPHFVTPDGMIKIPAGWLIEQAGLKGYSAHGMKTYEENALVFVNHSAQSYADLLAFQAEIVAGVQSKFGIFLEQEPETISAPALRP